MNICYPHSLLAVQLLEKYGPEVRDRVMSHIESDQFKEKFGQLKAEASTFTYKGNTIETPFKLSTDQEQALTRLSEFINDPTSVSMTLEGAAGTGKTTIIGLLKKLTNSKFVFSAPTHAATAELAKAVVRFGETRLPTTVRSSLAPKKDENGKQVYENGVPQYVFAKKIQDRFGYGSVKVLVVDEVSMIGDSDFINLHTAAKNSGVKIIFLGDRAQLPEPKSPTISKAFTEIPSTNLTTVHRQKDQQLAEFLTQVRSMNSFVPLKLENSATTTFTPDRLTFEQQFVEQVKKDPEGTVWIADTNKAVKEANTHIRDLFGREGAVQKGDVLVGYLGYESKQVEKGNLANAISYTVEDAKPDPNYPGRTLLRLSSKRLNDLEDSGIDIPTIVQSTYLQLSSSDSLQGVGITSELMAKNNEFVSNYFEAIVNAKDRKQWKALDTAKTEVAMTFAKIDLGDTYIYNPKTKKMELYSPSSPEHSAIVKTYGKDLVIEKGVDFGHAITIYKAQGATIPHVFVDMGSFRSVADQEIKDTKGNPVTTVKQSLYYVALSRAQDSLTVYQGNFGFLPYTPKPAQPKANPNEPTLEWVEQNVLDLPEVQQNPAGKESTQVKPGVQELFESNPEVANAVYEALGFKVDKKGVIELTHYSRNNQNPLDKFQEDFPLYTSRGENSEYKDYGKQFNFIVKKDANIKSLLDFHGKYGIDLDRHDEASKGLQPYHFSLQEVQAIRKEGVDILIDDWGEYLILNPNSVVLKEQQKQQAQQVYSQYLDTIFPDSKVKDIVYHGTNMKLDEIKFKSLGLTTAHFIDNKEFARLWAEDRTKIRGEGSPEVYAVVVNILNNENDWDDGVVNKYDNNGDVTGNEVTMRRESDIHLLGSKQDIEGFEKFVGKEKQPQTTREYTPENIESLKPGEVFVFGSNTEGRHGKGAALKAKEKFGATQGKPAGKQGQSYAIVTKNLTKGVEFDGQIWDKTGERSVPLDYIGEQFANFFEYANNNPNNKFYVTKLGSSLAGYTTEEIREVIRQVNDINGGDFIGENVILPKEYEVRDKVEEKQQPQQSQTLPSQAEIANLRQIPQTFGDGSTLKDGLTVAKTVGGRTNFQNILAGIRTQTTRSSNTFAVPKKGDYEVHVGPGGHKVLVRVTTDPYTPNETDFNEKEGYANSDGKTPWQVHSGQFTDKWFSYQYEVVAGVGPNNELMAIDYSGGALGVDSYFGNVASSTGVVSDEVHFYHKSKDTEKKNFPITDEELKEGVQKLEQVYLQLGRPAVDKYKSLHGRNWFQVKNADAIFAVSDLVAPGEKGRKGYDNKTGQINVEGGTGYAVQMAINEGKPVYVFHQKSVKSSLEAGWYQYNYESKTFVPTDVPTLTTKFAGIGTSDTLLDNGKQAIQDVVKKTRSEGVRYIGTSQQVSVNASTIIALTQPKARINRKDLTPAMIAARKEEIRKTFIEEALANPDKEFQVPWKNPRVGNYPDDAGFKLSDYVLFFDSLRTEYGDKFPTNLKFYQAFEFEMNNNPDRMIRAFAEKINAFNSSRLPWRIDESKIAAMNAKMEICLVDSTGKVTDAFAKRYGEDAQKDMADFLNFMFIAKYNRANGIIKVPELFGTILKTVKKNANTEGPQQQMWKDVVASFSYGSEDPKLSFVDLMFENLAFLGYRIELDSRNQLKGYLNAQKNNPNFTNDTNEQPLVNIDESENWQESIQDFIDDQLANDWLQVEDLKAEVIKGWQDSSFERNTKDSATARLKIFMAGQMLMEDLGASMFPYESEEPGVEDISHLDLESLTVAGARQLKNKKLKHKDYPTTEKLLKALEKFKLLPERSSIGMSKLMPFDMLWERVQGLLADVPNLRFQQAMDILKAENDPNLDMLVERLQEDKPGMARNRAELIKIMNMQYNQFLIADVNQGSPGKAGEGRIFNAQRYNQLQTIRKEWKDAQMLAPIMKVRPTGEKVIDVEQARHHLAFIKLMQLIGRAHEFGITNLASDEGKAAMGVVLLDYLNKLAVENPGAREFLKELNEWTIYGLIEEEATISSVKEEQRPIQKKFLQRMFYAHGITLSEPVLNDLLGSSYYRGVRTDFITGKIEKSKGSFAGTWLGQYSETKDEVPQPRGILSAFFYAAAGLSESTTIEDEVTDDLENAVKENNPLYTEGSSLDILASFAARHSPKLYNAVHRTLEGKQNWDYSHPSSLSNAVNSFLGKGNTTYGRELQETVFRTNYYLDKLRSSGFSLRYLEGLKVDNSDMGRVRESMSDREQLLTSLTLFANGGRKVKNVGRLMNVMSLAHSDKTVTPVFYNVPALHVFGKQGLGFSDAIVDAYYTLFEGEWKRIARVQQLKEKGIGTGSAALDAGGEYFFLLPGFNKDMLGHNAMFLYNEDGTIKTDLTDVKDFINQEIKKYLTLLGQKTEEYFSKTGVTLEMFDKNYTKQFETRQEDDPENPGRKKEVKLKPEEVLQKIAWDYALNTNLWNSSAMVLFMGDPANAWTGKFDTTFQEISKRLAKDIAPGLQAEFETDTYAQLTLEDVIMDYKYAAALGSNVTNSKATDAQEYTTVKEHLTVMNKYGKMPDKLFETLMAKYNAGEDFDEKDLAAMMEPMGAMKPVYTGARFENGLIVYDYIKTMSFPLIPQLTRKTQLDKLRLLMEGKLEGFETEPGVDKFPRVTFKSGSKLGTRTAVKVFDENGNFITPTKEALEKSVRNLSRSNFKIQQEVPSDDEKTHLDIVTQMDKLICEGILSMDGFVINEQKDSSGNPITYTGKQVRAKKEEIRIKASTKKLKDLLDKLQITNIEDPIPPKRVIEMLVETARATEYSPNDVALLESLLEESYIDVDEKGNRVDKVEYIMEYPIFFHSAVEKFEKLLLAQVKKITKFKMPGKSYVQASSIGMIRLGQLSQEDKDGIVLTGSWDMSEPLKHMHEKDGKIVGAQVIAPFNFHVDGVKQDVKDYLIPGSNMLDMDRVPKELLQLIGARIPNQGHNSMLAIEIVGFTPDWLGDLMIVPGAITGQMGSDFDVDKLYTYQRPYTRKYVGDKGYGFGIDEAEDLQLDYFNIHWGVLTHPKMYTKVMSALDKKDLGEANKKYAKVETGLHTYFSMVNQLKTFQSAKDAKALVGITSLLSTFESNIQNKTLRYGSYISTKEGPQEDPWTLELDGLNLTHLSGEARSKAWDWTEESQNWYSKHDNITIDQTGAVDNAKNRELDNLNISVALYPAIAAMNMFADVSKGGTPIALSKMFQCAFTTQEIMWDFTDEFRRGNDSLSDEYDADLKNNIIKKLEAKYTALIKDMDPNEIDEEVRKTRITLEVLDAAHNSAKNNKDNLYYIRQLAVLRAFDSLSVVGERLAKLQKTLNQETNGAGPSLAYVLQQKENYNKLGQRNEGKVIMGEYELLEKGQLSATFNQVIPTAEHLLNSVFPVRAITRVLEDVAMQQNKSLSDLSLKTQVEIIRQIRIASISTSSSITTNPEEQGIRLLYNSTASPSLATRVQLLKAKNEKNTFLKRINTDINALGKGPDFISFVNQKSARSTDNKIIQDFAALLQSQNEEERRVAEDIVMYTLMFTPQYSSNSIFSKLPSGVLLGTDVAASLRNAYANLREGIVYAGFRDQLRQHMPSLAFKIDRNTLDTCLPQYKIEGSEYPEVLVFADGENEHLRIVQDKPGEEPGYTSYLTFYSKDEKKQILYKLKGVGDLVTYQRIDTSRKVSQYDAQTSGPVRSIIPNERAAYGFNDNTEHYNLVNTVAANISATSDKKNTYSRWGLHKDGNGSLVGTLQQMSADPAVPAYLRTLGAQLAETTVPDEVVQAARAIGVPWKALTVQVKEIPAAGVFRNNTISLSPGLNIKTSAETLVHETLHSRSLYLLQALGWMNMNKLRQPGMSDAEFQKIKNNYEFQSSMFAAQHPVLYNKAKALDKLRMQALDKLKAELAQEGIDVAAWEEALNNRKQLDSDPRHRLLYDLLTMEEFVVNALTRKETMEFLNTIESTSKKSWYQDLVDKFLEFWSEVLKVLGDRYNDKSILKEVLSLSYELNTLQESKKPVQVGSTVMPQQLIFETQLEADHMSNIVQTVYEKDTKITSTPTSFRLDIFAESPAPARSLMIDRALKSLDKQLSRLDDIIAGSIHSDEDRARKNRAEVLHGEVKADREMLAESNDLIKMTEVGTAQLNWVQELLKRPTIHISEVNLANEILDTWNTINEAYKDGFESDNAEFDEKVHKVMGLAQELVSKVLNATQKAVVEEGIAGTGIRLLPEDFGARLQEIHATQAALIAYERDANRLSQMLSTYTQYHVQSAEAAKRDLRQDLLRFMSLVTSEQYQMFIQENEENTVFGLVQELSPNWYHALGRYAGNLRHRLEDLNVETSIGTEAAYNKTKKAKEAFEHYWKDNEEMGVVVPIDKILDPETGDLLSTPEAEAALNDFYSKVHRTAGENAIKTAQKSFKKYLDLQAVQFAHIEATTKVEPLKYEDLTDAEKLEFDALPLAEQMNYYKKNADSRKIPLIKAKQDRWRALNSPLSFMNTRPEPGVTKDMDYYRHRAKFKAWFAPKNTDDNLDPKFQAIQADPKLKEAYELLMEVSQRLREMLPPSKADKTLDNFFPIITLSQMREMQGVMHDFMKTSIGQKMQAGFEQLSITSEEKKYRESKKKQLKVKYVKPVPRNEDKTVNLDNVSTDIPRVFEMFGNMIIHYHHMHPVKELSDAATRMVKEAHKSRIIAGDKGLPNLLGLMEYYQDMLIYKMPRAHQGVSDAPVYSANYFENRRLTKEMDQLKKRSIELVGLINDEYAKTGEFLPEDHPLVQESLEIKKRQEEINSMARYMVGSKVTDALIGIQQLKSMSYNPFSAVANLGFGYMSTMMHARGFRAEEDGYTKGDFTVEQLKLAYKMMKGNIGRSWMKAFGYEGDELNRKIKAIIDRVGSIEALIDVNYGKTNLVESQSDVQKFFDPYAAQKSGDFLTKGACIIARALNTKVEVMIDGEAKTINLFEALGNDGEWNAEKYGENKAWSNREDRSEQTAWNKFTLRARKIQLLVFGAQDRLIPQKFREDMWLRLLGQFKASWIPEGIKTRFGSHQGYDEVLEREIEGRYRTLWRMPGKGVGVLLRQALSAFTGKNAFEGVQIWRTVDGVRTLVNIGEHEKENMRRNLVEFAYIALFLSSYFLLKASLPDDEEMKRRKRLGIDRTQAQKVASNMLYRMYQDLAMYSSPAIFDQITSNPVPSWSVIKDILAVPKAWARFAYDEEYELSKPLLKTTKAIPFLNLINKCNTYMNSDLSALVR